MCGHVGVAGDLTAKSMKAFADLLLFDQVRGIHATGIACVPWRTTARTSDSTEVFKVPVPASIFLDLEYTKELLRSTTHSVVLGHNRHATMGKKTVENCHPFIFDGLVGAHNGTVGSANLRKNLEWLDRDDNERFDTDSETIYAAINEDGPEKVITNLESGSSGAWALVWYDFEANTVNFIRNDQRPLYYAFSKDEKQLYWASEAYMLKAACSRHNIDIDKVKMFALDTLYKWVVPETNQKFNVEGVAKTKMPGKKPAPIPARAPYSSGYPTTWTKGANNATKPGKTSSTKTSLGLSGAAQDIEPFSLNALKSLLSGYRVDSDELFKVFKARKGGHACVNCGIPVNLKQIESGACGTLTSREIVCPSCTETLERAPQYSLIKSVKSAFPRAKAS